MKRIAALLFLLLLVGCEAPPVDIEEITDTTETEPEVEVVEEDAVEEVDTVPYYNFTEEQSQEILGNTITVDKIYQDGRIMLTIDGVAADLEGTKNEEIIGDLKVMMSVLHYSNTPTDKYITLKIEDFILESNQYLLYQNSRKTISGKDFILKESQPDGLIEVSVFNKGTVVGETVRIKRGETLEVNGLLITNVKAYYMVSQYALIEVQ